MAAVAEQIPAPPVTDNPFAQWVAAYYDNPVAFAEDMLDIKLFDYQKGPLIAMAGGQRKIAVRSGHGTGKSTDAAIAALWFLLTRYPCRIVATAPTIAQLDSVLFAAIRAYILLLPPSLQELLEVQRDKIFLRAAPDEAWAAARTARAENPEALAGVHAENVLLIADEASGIPEAVYEHAIGSMSGEHAHTLLLSNPTRRSGYFYRLFNDRTAGEGWAKFHFSCIDSDLVSEDFIQEVKNTYGEDSNAYRVRVLGEFPLEDIDALITGDLVQSAIDRDIQTDLNAPAVLGVDVARMGADNTALVLRRENSVEDIKTWSKTDLMETTGRVIAYLAAMPPERRPVEICVDSIGVGAGVADRLREVVLQRNWPIDVLAVNVAEAATLDERAAKLKDELILKLKDWLDSREVSLPDHSDLYADLVAPGYKFNSSGKIQVESKDEMKRRGQKSTDLLDALALTFAGNGYNNLHGRRSSWNKPLKRNLKGVF